jgi:membrane-associated phospholipid phosphatase
MFEPKARPIYYIIGFDLIAAAILYGSLGLKFANVSLVLPSAALASVLVSAFAARRAGLSRVATWLEATTLVYLQAVAGWLLFFPATVFAVPYGDWWLSLADRALGFDFPALYHLTKTWPFRQAYAVFNWEPALIMLLLVIYRKEPWRFVAAMAIALIVTAIVYPLAPAIGPVGYYGLGPKGPWTPMIEAMRDHGVRTITPKMLVGMVSLPSYHTAVGVICVWAAWPLKWFRWPFVGINAAMIFSTIPFGQHYLVDDIAGAAVAWLAIWLAGLYLREAAA